jgi:hypothetical protein
MQPPELDRHIPIDSLEKYGLRIKNGDSYRYLLDNSYYGPNYDSSGSFYTTLSEKAVFDAVIGDIYETEDLVTIDITIHYQGIRVTTSQGLRNSDSVNVDTLYSGTVQFGNSTFTQNIEGFSIQLFSRDVINSSHSDGYIIVLADTLHYRETLSTFGYIANQALPKQSIITSSWDSVDYFITENAILLWKEISIASGSISQRYLLELDSLNGLTIEYPSGKKPYKYISP